MKPEAFLKIFGIEAPKPGDAQAGPMVQMATVDASYTGAGRPRLILYGEDVASTRTYRMAKGLALVAGDLVLVVMIGQGGGGIVVCAIGP